MHFSPGPERPPAILFEQQLKREPIIVPEAASPDPRWRLKPSHSAG